jgi:MoaA/NifB/PqqE/SkfB family radical SAM enzyme
MSSVVVELTNRCNLSCSHCFVGRHGGSDNLPIEILETVLSEAPSFGFDRVSFTGGEPTLYRWFGDAVRLTAQAGLRFGIVTNGWSFARAYPQLLEFRDALELVVFSLDGATATTHDGLRGEGSFRRVLQAVSVCVAQGIPFGLNTVVTAHNRHELPRLVDLGSTLGAVAVRLCHLMPSPLTTAQRADLSPRERHAVEEEVQRLAGDSAVPVLMAPGFFTEDLFPCGPLQMEEINIDVHGNLTKCCHLSGHGNGTGQADVVGNLAEMSFADAYQLLRTDNDRFHEAKLAHFAENLVDTDYFPCWYCSLFFEKLDWLAEVPGHPWGELIQQNPNRSGRQWQPVAWGER